MSVNTERESSSSFIAMILNKALERAYRQSQGSLLYKVNATDVQISVVNHSTGHTTPLFQVKFRSSNKIEFYTSPEMPRQGSKINEINIIPSDNVTYNETQINQVALRLLAIFEQLKGYKTGINYLPNDGCDDPDCL